jgi:hypothetical protein
MECASTHFNVIGLLKDAVLVSPVILQGQDKLLKVQRVFLLGVMFVRTGRGSGSRHG